MRAVVPLSLLGVVLVASAVLSSQQAPPSSDAGQPTFRTGIGLVRVDVTVSTNRDQPIDDLTLTDFDVREDGVPQVVETMQFVRLTGTRGPGDDTSLEIRSPEHAATEAARDDVRLLVILLDDYHLRYGRLHDYKLKRLLRDFVTAEMRETDLFAVMDPLTPIDSLNLTRNRQDVFDRIERFEGRLGGFVPPRSPLEESHLYLSGAQRERIRAEITLSALESLAGYLGALREGRKSVLLVSEGAPLMVDGGTIFDRLQRVITAANRGNVTINTLDPRELGESRMASGSNETLAAETGGRRLAQSNDYSEGLRAVMSDASSYYLLGYAPKRPVADGKFHEIDVKVKRKGVRVLARKGYWAPTPEESRPRPPAPSAPADVTTALSRLTVSSRQRAMTWWLGFERDPHGGTLATFSWEPAGTSSEPAARAAALVAIDPGTGTEVESVAGAGSGAATRGPWHVTFTMPPGGRTLRIRVAAADGETVDSWNEDVVVPNLSEGELTLGTLRVYRAATPSAWRALVEDPSSLAPVANRRLRRTDRVLVTVPLSADATGAKLRAELQNAQGKTLVTLPVTVRVSDATPRVELPLANLAQADYLLRVTATRADGTTSSQVLAFAVES